MRLRTDRIGALNLFSHRPGGLSDEDQHVAQAMADIATIGVLQARAIHDGQVVAAQLQTALESRIAIEQAKGILAEHMAISVDDAFTLLRNYSNASQHQAHRDGAPHCERQPARSIGLCVSFPSCLFFPSPMRSDAPQTATVANTRFSVRAVRIENDTVTTIAATVMLRHATVLSRT